MQRLLCFACCLLLILGTSCRRRGHTDVDYDRQLAPGEQALVQVDPASLPGFRLSAQQRTDLRTGIARSLRYLKTATAEKQYRGMQMPRQRVIDALQQMDELLARNLDDRALRREMQQRFALYRSVGYDGRGSVLFTGYYTPIFEARRSPDDTFRHPVYRRPDSLVTAPGRTDVAWLHQAGGSRFPDRATIERDPQLRGQPLVYVDIALDAYIIQVQGSAKLRLASDEQIDIGVDGTNGQPYGSLRQMLIADGHLDPQNAGLPGIRQLYQRQPQLVQQYMLRNPRFVFFTETTGGPFGSIGQEVISDVTIATDKDIFPPGALCLVACQMGHAQDTTVSLRLDQDTGGAIQAPGRCDLYMGVGQAAEQRAGIQLSVGALYYLVAR